MATYVSDKEDIEMLKNWWRENGKVTLLSVVLAIALSAGWHYWQRSKAQDAADASLLYEQMLHHQASQQLSRVEFAVTDLETNHPQTPYASLAAFIAAQNAILAMKFDVAIRQFDWVIDNSKNRDFRQVARIRKARVLREMKKYDDAITALQTIDAQTYLPLINEVRGDILSAKGDKLAAKAAYQQALHSLRQDATNRAFLQMKYDQLND